MQNISRVNFLTHRSAGFTLIELLVVIAIIGLLASIILASLSAARSKGGDANVKGTMNSLRSQAEIYNSDNGASYSGFCSSATTTTMLNNVRQASGATNANNVAIAVAGSAGTVTCHATANGFAVQAPLKSDNAMFWCIDSGGKAATSSSAATQLPANGTTCI